MGLDKDTSKLIALHYASQRSALRLRALFYDNSNAVQKFVFDFLEAYTLCRKMPIQGSPNKYWQEVSENTETDK